MTELVNSEVRKKIRRIGTEPMWWVRENIPQVKDWEIEFNNLVDAFKLVHSECSQFRINLCFALDWSISGSKTDFTIQDFTKLQQRQNSENSRLIFRVDLAGQILEEIDLEEEIEPNIVMHLSRWRESVIFWVGPEFEVYCNGLKWEPGKNKVDVLKNIKSKRRNRLLSMDNYRKVLDTHYEQFIRDEARVNYWFVGKRSEVLQCKPEVIFQKSLWDFLNREVDCEATREHMFKDSSRCDIKVFVENFDLYFIEIKWIGHSAKKVKNLSVITAEETTEFKADRAIEGAYQTKTYIEKNNNIEYDPRIKLGIFLLYDAYPTPITPLNYGSEIEDYPLLDVIEYQLVTQSPSAETKGIAKQKGLI